VKPALIQPPPSPVMLSPAKTTRALPSWSDGDVCAIIAAGGTESQKTAED